MLDQHDLTMIADIMNQALTPVKEDISFIKKDIVAMKADIVSMKDDIASLQEDTRSMKADIVSMKDDISSLQEDTRSMKADIASLQEDTRSMKDDIASLQEDTRSIKLTIENNICRAIDILSEGHLRLNEKLDEIILEQKEQRKREDMFELYLKSHSIQISSLKNTLNNLPCQRGTSL